MTPAEFPALDPSGRPNTAADVAAQGFDPEFWSSLYMNRQKMANRVATRLRELSSVVQSPALREKLRTAAARIYDRERAFLGLYEAAKQVERQELALAVGAVELSKIAGAAPHYRGTAVMAGFLQSLSAAMTALSGQDMPILSSNPLIWRRYYWSQAVISRIIAHGIESAAPLIGTRLEPRLIELALDLLTSSGPGLMVGPSADLAEAWIALTGSQQRAISRVSNKIILELDKVR